MGNGTTEKNRKGRRKPGKGGRLRRGQGIVRELLSEACVHKVGVDDWRPLVFMSASNEFEVLHSTKIRQTQL